MPNFGFWTDLRGLQFADGSSNLSWVHSMSVGDFEHPRYGRISLTHERIRQFAANIKNRIRGTDLDIDYDHKVKDGRAAGWVRDADAREDGLWLLVEWTKDAAESIRKREWRYFSPEFVDKWKSPKGEEFSDVVFGGALTNRPFLKDLQPINLSEVIDMEASQEQEDAMNDELRKLLAKRFGLSEDATEEQVLAKLSEEPQTVDLAKASVVRQDDGVAVVTIPGVDGQLTIEPVKASEQNSDDDIKKLAEDNPAIAKLLSEREEDRKRLAALENANKLSDVDRRLGSIEGLPPAVVSELREIMLAAPSKLSEQIEGVVSKLAELGTVPGGQVVRAGNKPGSADNPIKKFTEAVDKKMSEDDKLTYGDAVSIVGSEQPHLYDEYAQYVAQFGADEEIEEVS